MKDESTPEFRRTFYPLLSVPSAPIRILSIFYMKLELEILEPQTQRGQGSGTGDGFRVILYNDDWHSVDEVVTQVQKATGCSQHKAIEIVLEVDARGRGICYRGDREKCQSVAAILREIRLQCEVDCD